MTVDSIMSCDVVTVGPDTALRDIRAQLHERGFRHLLVVEEEGLLGVISDREVLRALGPLLDASEASPPDGQTVAQPAREVMRSDPLLVTPGTSIQEASDLLLAHDVTALPVVEDEGLVGLVTTSDLLHHYTNGR